MKVSRVSEMRNLDATAIEKFGIKDELLMAVSYTHLTLPTN